MPLNKETIEKIIGQIDEGLAIRIIDTGATRQELMEAYGWFIDSQGMKAAGHHRPAGKVVEVCEILESGQVPRERD